MMVPEKRSQFEEAMSAIRAAERQRPVAELTKEQILTSVRTLE